MRDFWTFNGRTWFLEKIFSPNFKSFKGALTIGLKHPELFKSISVFAPICNPMKKTPNFGYKHLEAFLGPLEGENILHWEKI